MCVKLDLAKAYDKVWWDFLEDAMKCMRFPLHFINLIMAFVQGPHFFSIGKWNISGLF